MADLVRPTPRLPWRERAGALLTGVTIARLATAAGAVLLLAVTAWWLLRSPAPPVEQALPRAGSATTPAAATSVAPTAVEAPTTTTGELVVQAAGAVVSPGVYRVPGGSRVLDVVTAAGGPASGANLQAVPLAARVVDGQRVYVPVDGEVVASVDAGAPGLGPPTAEAPLDLNQATVEQLDQLPGVGPTTAQAIVEYRSRHGPLVSVDELLEVPGIGPAKLDAMRELVRADG